jgi:hypothetical protein
MVRDSEFRRREVSYIKYDLPQLRSVPSLESKTIETANKELKYPSEIWYWLYIVANTVCYVSIFLMLLTLYLGTFTLPIVYLQFVGLYFIPLILILTLAVLTTEWDAVTKFKLSSPYAIELITANRAFFGILLNQDHRTVTVLSLDTEVSPNLPDNIRSHLVEIEFNRTDIREIRRHTIKPLDSWPYKKQSGSEKVLHNALRTSKRELI